MFEKEIGGVADLLTSKGFSFSDGLSEQELQEAQNLYSITFPPDLREFYRAFQVNGFCSWRDTRKQNVKKIKARLSWPSEGILFDVKYSGFWMESWGKKPISIDRAVEIGREKLQDIPPLIPLCYHRFLPSCPDEAGNPVLSVHQTDIIYYGKDLFSYFHQEFGKNTGEKKEQVKHVPFWGYLVERNDHR